MALAASRIRKREFNHQHSFSSCTVESVPRITLAERIVSEQLLDIRGGPVRAEDLR